jgi:hypothetical protein
MDIFGTYCSLAPAERRVTIAMRELRKHGERERDRPSVAIPTSRLNRASEVW